MGMFGAGVCLRRSSGEIDAAPHLGIGILGRGAHQVDGQWGPFFPAFGTPLGTAVFISRQPRYRVGLGSATRQHARYQLKRDVHRIGGSVVDRRGVYGAFGAGQAGQGELLGKADRTGAGHGRVRDASRSAARTVLSRSSCVPFRDRFVGSSYTMLAAARFCARAEHGMRLLMTLNLGKLFEENGRALRKAFEPA